MAYCPYAKSEMTTPCVLRDGDICYALGADEKPICVGCERSPAALNRPDPPDWQRTVAAYKRKHRR